MKILAAASDRSELKAFGDGYLKVVTGVGPVLAAASVAAAIERFHPDIIVSTGTAGSFGTLSSGDVVSFGSVIFPDADLTAYGLKRGETLLASHRILSSIPLDSASSLVLATSSSFASSVIEGADAADMEAYGVAVAAYNAGIPCLAVKGITDRVGERMEMKEYFSVRKQLLPLLEKKVSEIIQQI